MQKYWVPAIERAHVVLSTIMSSPSRLPLIELSKQTGINKSSIFSLLATMESLGWVVKEENGTYALGPQLGMISASYFRQFDLVTTFKNEAKKVADLLGETIQLGRLNGQNVLYLAQQTSKSPMRLSSSPGEQLPAYATALGKALLSSHSYSELISVYPEEQLKPLTPRTIRTREHLWEQLEHIRDQGYAIDEQEAVEGFFCVAAPIKNHENRIIAAVSVTMLESSWSQKFSEAAKRIVELASRLSRYSGLPS
ncbi:IclR family transcriptional regulator [Alicyclobacillus dauci]|uniref:IclR family transcriptional regulator n=1 Tax=Alicyclobacillus dauci TaxID=1475485 RepID=A0ABY6Z2Q1_9BACL|nr:IclR family transcriptional regulator [Alicyclobacillus dauci]WAH37111.1 IclR family transcriptional regulator [Alicyclobacillus dauci]